MYIEISFFFEVPTKYPIGKYIRRCSHFLPKTNYFSCFNMANTMSLQYDMASPSWNFFLILLHLGKTGKDRRGNYCRHGISTLITENEQIDRKFSHFYALFIILLPWIICACMCCVCLSICLVYKGQVRSYKIMCIFLGFPSSEKRIQGLWSWLWNNIFL